MSTVKLYDGDAYLAEFQAVVLDCKKCDRGYCIILDRTAFFPEGGGQISDSGKIGDVKVFDVQIDDGGVIRHYTEAPVPTGEAFCRIDFDLRFRRMQNHSGEHIVSGIVSKLFGLSNVGFHIGSQDVTIDYDGELTRADVEKVEYLANIACSEDIPIIASYPDEKTLSSIEYRSKKELSGDIRIVEIPGYDACACCAPHVNSTGSVGMIKLLDMIKYKGGVRLHMKCGLDALEDFRDKHRNVAEIARLLSAKQSEAFPAVERLLSDYEKLKRDYSALSKLRVLERLEREEYREGNMLLFESGLDAETQRALANAGRDKCSGVFLALVGDDESGYRYIASSVSVKLREYFASLPIAAKGGGDDKMMQGMIRCKKEEILSAFGV